MTNEELIVLAKSGDSEAYNQLFRQNIRLVHKMAHSWESTRIEHEDLVSIIWIGMVKAYKSFDTSKGCKFNTLFYRIANNEIRLVLKNNSRNVKAASFEQVDEEGKESTYEPVYLDEGYNRLEFIEFMEMIANTIESVKLTNSEMIVLHQLLLGEKVQRYVSELLGTSEAWVTRLKKRMQQKFRESRKAV